MTVILVVADNKTKYNFNLSYSEKSTGYFELLRKHTGSVILGFISYIIEEVTRIYLTVCLVT